MSAICHIQFQWNVAEHFRNRTKKNWGVTVQKSPLEKKNYSEIKNSQTCFCFLYVKLDTANSRAKLTNKFLLTCSLHKTPIWGFGCSHIKVVKNSKIVYFLFLKLYFKILGIASQVYELWFNLYYIKPLPLKNNNEITVNHV